MAIHGILHFAHRVDGSISNFVGRSMSSTASGVWNAVTASSLMAAGGFIGGVAYGVYMTMDSSGDNIVNKLYENAVKIVLSGAIAGAIAGGASMLIKLACKIATYAWAHLPPIGKALYYGSYAGITIGVAAVCILAMVGLFSGGQTIVSEKIKTRGQRAPGNSYGQGSEV